MDNDLEWVSQLLGW
jgi:hypothetical protein